MKTAIALISMMSAVASIFAIACASTVQEGKPVPEHLKAKAIDFQNKKAYCARTAKTDVEFSECLGVDWETLKTDQTGIH